MILAILYLHCHFTTHCCQVYTILVARQRHSDRDHMIAASSQWRTPSDIILVTHPVFNSSTERTFKRSHSCTSIRGIQWKYVLPWCYRCAGNGEASNNSWSNGGSMSLECIRSSTSLKSSVKCMVLLIVKAHQWGVRSRSCVACVIASESNKVIRSLCCWKSPTGRSRHCWRVKKDDGFWKKEYHNSLTIAVTCILNKNKQLFNVLYI